MENSGSDFDCMPTMSTPSTSSRENLFLDSDSLSRCPCANCCNFTRHRQKSFVCSSCSRLTSCSSCLSRDSAASTDRQTPPGGRRDLDDNKTESDHTTASAHYYYYGGDEETFKSSITEELKSSSNNNAAPCCFCRRSFRCPQQRSSTATSSSLGWDSATLVRSISSLTDHITDDRFFSEFYYSDTSVSSASIPEQRRHQVARRLDRCPAATRSRSADAVKQLSHQLQHKNRDVQETNPNVSSSARFCQIVKTLYRDETYTCLSTLTAQENADACRSECKSKSYIVLCSNNSNTVFFDHSLPLDNTVKRKEWRSDCTRLPRNHVETIHFCRECRTLCRPSEYHDRKGDVVFSRKRKVRCSKKADRMDFECLDPDYFRRGQNTPTINRSRINDRRSSDASFSSSDCDDIRRLTIRNPCSEQSHCPRRYIDTCAIATDERKEDVSDSATNLRFSDEDSQFDSSKECESQEMSESEFAEGELFFSDELYVESVIESFEYPAILQPLRYFVGKASISTEVDLESLRPSSLVFGMGPVSELESDKIALDTFSPIPSTTQLAANKTSEPNFRTPLRGRRKSIRLTPQLAPTLTVYSGYSLIPDDSDKLKKANATIVANELERPSIMTKSVEYLAIVLREPSMETLYSKEFQSIEPYMKAQLVTDDYNKATTIVPIVHLLFENQDSLPDAQSITSIKLVYAETSEVDDPSMVSAVVIDNVPEDMGEVMISPVKWSDSNERVIESLQYPEIIQPLKYIVGKASISTEEDLKSLRPNSLVLGVSPLSAAAIFENEENLPEEQMNDIASIKPVYADIKEVDDPSLVNAVVVGNAPEAMGRLIRSSNNKTKEVVAAEDLDIPIQSFTDASKIWTLSSDFGGNHLEQTPWPSESPKASRPDENEDSNPSCLKELLALVKKDEKTPPSTTCSETSVRQGDRWCHLLPDSVYRQRKVIKSLNNSLLTQNYAWSTVTHLLEKPHDSVAPADCRCAFHDSHDRRKQRCKCLRRLSRNTISNDQKADSKFNQNYFLDESKDRSNLSSCCRTRQDSNIYNDCSCHYSDLMLSEAAAISGESEETDTITTIYTRLPASIQPKAALPRYPWLPLESHIPSRSGCQMTPAAEFDANCNQSDDIISSTIIASRKRHRKREVCDDAGRQSREKYYERKYKTLKHFCIKEFGRTKALLETLQLDDE